MDCVILLLSESHFYRSTPCLYYIIILKIIIATNGLRHTSTVWVALLPLESYFYRLSRTSTAWIVLLLSESHLYRLNYISTTWIVSLLSESYFYYLNSISAAWVAPLSLELYLYYLSRTSTVWIIFCSPDCDFDWAALEWRFSTASCFCHLIYIRK
jgi:hypothetical protein